MKIDACAENSIAAILLAALIAVYDYHAGASVSLWALYFAPIAVSAWHCGLRGALAFAALSSVLVLVVDGLVGNPYPTTRNYVVAVAWHILALFVVAGLAGYAYRLADRLRKLERTRR